jgi:hypothetical protein
MSDYYAEPADEGDEDEYDESAAPFDEDEVRDLIRDEIAETLGPYADEQAENDQWYAERDAQAQARDYVEQVQADDAARDVIQEMGKQIGFANVPVNAVMEGAQEMLDAFVVAARAQDVSEDEIAKHLPEAARQFTQRLVEQHKNQAISDRALRILGPPRR